MEEFFDRLNTWYKKYSKYVLMLLLIVLVILILKFLPFLIILFLPFLISWLISYISAPLVNFLKKRAHIPYKLGALISVLILLTLLTLIISYVVIKLKEFSGWFVTNWIDIYKTSLIYLSFAVKRLSAISSSLPFDFMGILQKAIQELGAPADFISQLETSDDAFAKLGSELSSQLSKWLMPSFGNVATGTLSFVMVLSNVFVFIIILILATYFMTGEREKIRSFYSRNISISVKQKLFLLKRELFGACGKYLKAQFLLMCITAIELIIGLFIMGVEHAILIGVLIAIVDILPVLGTGTILIPWAIVSLLQGDLFMALGMVLLYILTLLVRRFAEPKIVSKSLGLNPVVTLILMYVGLKIYGLLGMIIFPIGGIIAKKLYDLGFFDWFFTNRTHKKENPDGVDNI
ncbi:MAG: sporulation integral membrane protein YtvI [Bacillota bacterium]|nr:sporulation integral membrane protein YtvI [Bacillota bacterium]